MGISWDIKKHMRMDEYHDELGHVCDHRSTDISTHLEGGHSNIAIICNLMVSRNKPMRMCVDDETVM